MRFVHRISIAILAFVLAVAGMSAWPASGPDNFHKVSDSLYRSAQPTAEEFMTLKELGIVTVVNLRSFHSDRKEIGTTGLAYEHIYMKAWHPEHEDITRFLQIVTDPKRTPVLVHCQHGSDRTGTMTAVYRIAVEGWSKEDAVQEMTSDKFGFHKVWSNLPRWIDELDVESIRREVGITLQPPRHPAGVANMKQFAERYTAAWSSQDPASVAAFFAENGSLTINGGTPTVGRTAITEVARSFMTGFPDLVLEMDALEYQDGKYRYRWTLTGTNTGPGGSGRKVRISGYEEWTIGSDGLVATSLGHYDQTDWDRQVGKEGT